jgi:hypothetical protein
MVPSCLSYFLPHLNIYKYIKVMIAAMRKIREVNLINLNFLAKNEGVTKKPVANEYGMKCKNGLTERIPLRH